MGSTVLCGEREGPFDVVGYQTSLLNEVVIRVLRGALVLGEGAVIVVVRLVHRSEILGEGFILGEVVDGLVKSVTKVLTFLKRINRRLVTVFSGSA
jgi:hypothetical protein